MGEDFGITETKYREFGAFLRSRRERLTPASVGLKEGARRRTKGLRREEVALLAGVGITWYTWLEQGREVHASPEVLSALADVLKLDPTERQHLFLLADRAPLASRNADPEIVETPLRRMLLSLSMQPAYVIGRRWDVLAWNKAAGALFGDYGRLDGDERNIMHLIFADKDHRALLIDWEEVAMASLAMFRADTVSHSGEPDFKRLIAKLSERSKEFRAWWPCHDVLRRLSSLKRIMHPQCGRMAFENTTFAVNDRPDMKLIVYTPLKEDNTDEKLKSLLL
jgi:transcriptional regulator with XRE-family HTH domain